MKTYEVYRNIRKRAVIFGLPVPLFAMMMVSVIGSLLIIIFSFGWGAVFSVLVFNIVLYIALSIMAKRPGPAPVKRIFPQTISNKTLSLLHYEDNKP